MLEWDTFGPIQARAFCIQYTRNKAVTAVLSLLQDIPGDDSLWNFRRHHRDILRPAPPPQWEPHFHCHHGDQCWQPDSPGREGEGEWVLPMCPLSGEDDREHPIGLDREYSECPLRSSAQGHMQRVAIKPTKHSPLPLPIPPLLNEACVAGKLSLLLHNWRQGFVNGMTSAWFQWLCYHMLLLFLQVPVFPEETIVYLRAEVKGKTVDLEKRQKVLISSTKPLMFIQTDKPIYKPGQTGTNLSIYLSNHTVLVQ